MNLVGVEGVLLLGGNLGWAWVEAVFFLDCCFDAAAGEQLEQRRNLPLTLFSVTTCYLAIIIFFFLVIHIRVGFGFGLSGWWVDGRTLRRDSFQTCMGSV